MAARWSGECYVRSLDLSHSGSASVGRERVTVRGTQVTWGGIDLATVGAVLVDAPVFPWPQPGETAYLASDREQLALRSTADREWRSLAASALAIASGQVALWNPVEAARWSASPALALVELAARGLSVAAWEFGVCGAASLEPDRTSLPATGRTAALADAGETPARCATDSRAEVPAPALTVSAAAGAEQLLVVDGAPVASGAWRPDRRGGAPERATAPEPGRAANLAAEAARALGLPLAAVVVVPGADAPAIAHLDAGPDLVAWDVATGGLAIDRTLEGMERVAGARGALIS